MAGFASSDPDGAMEGVYADASARPPSATSAVLLAAGISCVGLSYDQCFFDN